MMRGLLSKPFCRKKERNDPPSANQGLSTAKPRCRHAVFILQVNLPTSSFPTLSASGEPISQEHHTRVLIGCLFSCCMYVHVYVSIMLRNVVVFGQLLAFC